MKKAVITGATSGIGLEICRLFINKGYFVYGIGRNFDKIPFEENFEPLLIDLKDREKLCREIKKIRNDVDVLVNCAGVGYFGLHEEISAEKIHEMTAVNIEAPMIITSLMLRELKRKGGRIINISSVTAKSSSPHGAAYGATKAALTAFSESLFDEARKYGVKVSVIHPDMTDTAFYNNADFECEEGIEFSLSPIEVARAVETVLDAPYPIRDITLSPQKHRIHRK